MANRTVTASATQSVQADPELATVRATATGGGETPGGARAAAIDRAAAVRDALEAELGLAERVRTTGIECQDGADAFAETEAPFEATIRLGIDCTPETAGEAVVAATDAGGTVSRVEFALTDATRESLAEDATTAAVAQARETAAAMAATEGLALGEPLAIEQNDPDTWDDLVDDALARSSGTALDPDPIDVVADVTATYELVGE